MKVTDLHAFFEDACYPYSIKECFTKEMDLDRIRQNKKPLTFDDGQSLFITKYSPFSFLDVLEIVFNSFGNVLLIDKKGTGYSAIRPTDTMEVCIELLGIKTDQVIYRIAQSHTSDCNRYRSIEHVNVRAKEIETNLRKMFDDTNQCDISRNDVLYHQKTQLAALFFSTELELDELYFSLLSGNYITCITTRTTSNPGVMSDCKLLKRSEKALGVIYSKEDERVLFPTLYKDNIFYVNGCPIKRKSFFKPVEMGNNANPSGKVLDYSVVLSNVLTISVPDATKRFSVVVSSLCHLERFGHFPNEREIALEYQKQYSSMSHEENVSRLRKSWRKCGRNGDERSLPWTDLNDHKLGGGLRRSCESNFKAVSGNALAGLAEEIPTPIDSPFDSLKWIINDLCFYQGESFINQFYVLSGKNDTEENRLFLSILYAFFSGAMSNDSLNSIGLEYGHSRPSLDSYEWYLTRDGVLYYCRMRRQSHKTRTRRSKSSYRSRTCDTQGGDRNKPCFMEDIDMEVEDDNFCTSKNWTGKYTNGNKVKNRFYKNGDLLDERRSPTINYDGNTPSSKQDASMLHSKNGNRCYYDPFVLRKYDGKGLFPVLTSEEELKRKKDSNQIIFDSERFTEDSEGFFRLYNCFDTKTSIRETNEEETALYANEGNIPIQITDMIEFVSFFVQYSEQLADMESDSSEFSDFLDYDDEEAKKRRRKRYERKRSYEPIVGDASMRRVDHVSVCDELLKSLIPRGATLKKNIGYHEANPLWLQCCTFICSKLFKIRTICLTYNNVPKSIENIYFMLHFHQLRCEPNFAMCLGYVSPEERIFKYEVFECMVDIDRNSNLPSKYYIYRVTREEKKHSVSTVVSRIENRSDLKKELVVTKSLISMARFDNILDASVLFIINSGF